MKCCPPILGRLINILLNNCEYVDDRLVNERRYQDACRDPNLETGLDLKRKFVAPLAKRVSCKRAAANVAVATVAVAAVAAESAVEAVAVLVAVSYTHLTLPTICSV